MAIQTLTQTQVSIIHQVVVPTAAPPPAYSTDKTAMSGGSVAGIVVGVLVGLAILIAILLYWRKYEEWEVRSDG